MEINPKSKQGVAPKKLSHKGRAGFLLRKKWSEEAGRQSAKRTMPNPTVGKELPSRRETGWGGVAQWYHETVEDSASYQSSLILPNIIRLLDIKKGEMILDLACGEGFFARRFAKNGAKVIGVDIAKELIEIAQKQSPEIKYHAAAADKIPFIASQSIDKLTIILALQNIENVAGVFQECARVLKPAGKMLIVLNHPAFRIPKVSSWGWETSTSNESRVANGEPVQYRRIDKYMSELREKIDMAPGSKMSEHTISFHRPLQYFIKAIGKQGLVVANMEEWVSNKKSQPGPRALAEDVARGEIPLFMMLECRRSEAKL